MNRRGITTWMGISKLSRTCPLAIWTHCTSDASFMLPSPVGQMVSTRINCKLMALIGLVVSFTTIFPARPRAVSIPGMRLRKGAPPFFACRGRTSGWRKCAPEMGSDTQTALESRLPEMEYDWPVDTQPRSQTPGTEE